MLERNDHKRYAGLDDVTCLESERADRLEPVGVYQYSNILYCIDTYVYVLSAFLVLP